MIALTHAWNLSREPVSPDMPVDNLFPLPRLKPFAERFDYAISLGASERSSPGRSARASPPRFAMPQAACIRRNTDCCPSSRPPAAWWNSCARYASPSALHRFPSSSAKLYQLVRELLLGVAEKKQVPVLIIDEAHLLRTEVFAQMHLISQHLFDSRSLLPILAARPTDPRRQASLPPLPSLRFPRHGKDGSSGSSARGHEGLPASSPAFTGATKELLSEEAMLAIHQGSGGLLRRAGMLARGAFLAAAQESCPVVSAEHVRLASSEIF